MNYSIFYFSWGCVNYREEKDAMGTIRVPATALWGAQTQRSLQNFKISNERMPSTFIRALALVKRAASSVNHDLGLLDSTTAAAIAQAADEVIEGRHESEFPCQYGRLALVPRPT